MNAFRFVYFSGLMMVAFLAMTAIANAQTTVAIGQNLGVVLDIDACTSGFDFCSDSGSVGPAASSNNSVISVVVQVKRNNGTPFTGLTESSFSISSITNAGFGVTPAFVPTATCASCFLEVEPGVYRLAARPAFGDWGDGTYVSLIEVSSGAVSRQTIVPIDIPN